MKTSVSLKNRQGGAVAVMVGLSMVILIGFLALVIDLGHLYVAKTGLQNAADAAALSGAKQLNGTRDGVNKGTSCATDKGAVQCAIEAAAKNNYDFSSNLVDITIADIWVGSCPDDSCMVAASSIASDADAAGMTFLKVHTRNRSMATWFAPIWGILNTSTYGMAVAGKYAVDVGPVGICKLTIPGNPVPVNELGYERGVSYRVSDANPLGPGTPFWIDPVEMQTPTTPTCVTSNNNVGNSIDYVCTGKMAFTPTVGSTVYTNSGKSTPALRALDSRFNDYYNGVNKCDTATAPPDSNIKEYQCINAKGDNGCLKNPVVGLPRDWMAPDPAQPSITFTGGQPKSWSTRTFADYGVLWSAFRPTVAAGAANDLAVSTQWGGYIASIPTIQGLYHASPGSATLYPQTSPYAQTSGSYFSAPTSNTPKPGRRVLNIAILNCSGAGGTCRPMTVLGIGRFFMQQKAMNDNEIYVEFGGLLPSPMPTSDIRIYK